MSNINVHGRMAKKSTVRDMNGRIINMVDETNGGYIIKNYQVVNQEAYNEILKKEEDRKLAAKAITMQKTEENAPDRTVAPSKVDALEKKVEGMETKLDAILKALSDK